MQMEVGNKLNYFSVATFLIIVAISVFFHYPIYIADALTLEQLPDYDIKLSIWRILFEPIVGIILFFNRSLFTLVEIQILLYWIICIFISYTSVKAAFHNDKKVIKKYVLGQAVNIPILIGIWFAFFAVMLFIPLPGNTIVNNAPNTILVTTHSHSEYSHDGLISQEGLWKWHKRNGFDAFFITDHNNHDKTLDFVEAQRNQEFPVTPLVMCGEEFSGSNHMSLLGLKRKFSTRGFADSTVIDSVRASNGAVLVNHWYDGEHRSLEYYQNLGVDGFEIENTATDRTYDRAVYQRVKAFCERNQLIMNGGLDFHGYGNVCSLWNAIEVPGWHELNPALKEDAILNVIRSRDQSKLKVLQYKDRPDYNDRELFFSPLFTLFSYFRTLNIYQVISWGTWILLFTISMPRIANNAVIKRLFSQGTMLSLMGVFSATFLLILGMVYYSRIKHVVEFTELYKEYSTLLFSIGSVLLIYAGLVLYFKNRTFKITTVSQTHSQNIH